MHIKYHTFHTFQIHIEIYTFNLHSRRSGPDHTVQPANYTVPVCLYLVSVYQMALLLTVVTDI